MGNEMMEAYLFEMDTLLEQLDNLVMEAENQKTFSNDHVNEIFRIMHTIKGSSAMMEFSSLMTIAHRIEDLFYVIRDKTMDAVPEKLRPELFDLIFKSIDFFRAEVEKLKNGEPLNDSIDNFLASINSFANKISGQEEPAPAEAPMEAPAESAPAKSAPTSGEDAYGSPEFPYALHVFFDEGSGMENLRGMMLVNAVKDFCEDNQFDFYPADIQLNPDTAAFIVEKGFFLRFRTPEDRIKAIPAVKEFGSVRTYQTFDYSAAAESDSIQEQSAAQAAAGDVSQQPAEQPAAGAAQSNAKQSHAKESLISVNLSKLDTLMAVVGEIIITEAQVTASPDLKGLKLDNFNKAARQLRSLTDNLQDVALSLRMVPVSGTFQKQKRTVRDMCKKLNKEAVLVLEGEDTEIDKTIVDSISDPIMHIVRNSMDHGIEDHKEDRVALGKDPVGKIVLSARQAGGEVIIEVTDDGQGVDDENVLNKAIRQGLAQPGMEYSHKDILNFLLAPGFSTNTEVTEFSGRGVGMDVVKSNVESAGGTVSISSERGKGMTTTLHIPLTTSILDGMEVAAGGSIFTVPLSDIRQIFRVTSDQVILDAVHGEMIKIMDNFYSIVRAKDYFQMDSGVENFDDGVLLWVGSADRSFGLFVDELIGEQQIVVKPLPGYINNFGVKGQGITGCSVLGDGSISLILDVANIHENQM